MNKGNRKYLYLSLLVSLIVTVSGIAVYDLFFQKPLIIFEDRSIAHNVSGRESIKSPSDFSDIVEKNRMAVVYIHTITKDSGGRLEFETGSGFFVLPTGEIVTNDHVVANAELITVVDDNNNEYTATLVASDASSDIAVIKIEGNNFPFIFFGNSDNISVGDWILLIGSPFKLKNSVSAGIISALNRDLGLRSNLSIENYIQTDAVANPGNSGGAMLDKDGKLVGMISAVVSRENDYRGYSFAIPSNIVKKIAFDLINYGVVQRAWIGLSVINRKNGKGVLIERVDKNGAGYKAGLNTGDIIIGMDSMKIVNVPQFTGIIALHKPGDIIKLSVLRKDKIKEIPVRLNNVLQTSDLISNRKDESFYNLGLILRDLINEEKNKGFTGIYVVSVRKDSKIGNINMKPGFYITSLNDQKIVAVDDLIEIIESTKGKLVFKGYYKNYPGKFKYVLYK
jgi:S1-C subfamily serine protease